MTTKARRSDCEVPADMRRVCRDFERWRKGHKARLPIPERLWTAAAQVALEYGVFRTAKVLRLEYGKLKRRMESASPSPKLTGVSRLGPATFWELVPPQGVPSELGLSECLIELEGARGKMRIQWKGATALDLADLSRGLWESR
jgi:hypothetical protein